MTSTPKIKIDFRVGRVLVYPHGTMAIRGDKKWILSSRKTEKNINIPVLVIEEGHALGVISLNPVGFRPVEELTTEAAFAKHRVSKQEFKDWWDKFDVLWVDEVKVRRVFPRPIPIEYPHEAQVWVTPEEIKFIEMFQRNPLRGWMEAWETGEWTPEIVWGALEACHCFEPGNIAEALFLVLLTEGDPDLDDETKGNRSLAIETILSFEGWEDVKDKSLELAIDVISLMEEEEYRNIAISKIARELEERGLNTEAKFENLIFQYLPICSEKAASDRPASIEDLDIFKTGALIYKNAVVAVGSVPERGLGNDVDILIRKELPEELAKRIAFRIARACGTRKQTQFHILHDSGPYTTFVPLYDVAIVPVKQEVVRMEKSVDTDFLKPIKPMKPIRVSEQRASIEAVIELIKKYNIDGWTQPKYNGVHCVGGLTPLVTPDGIKYPRGIKKGDRIMGPKGDMQEVLATARRKPGKGEALFKIQAFGGPPIVVTGEHLLLTEEGWMRADEIKIGAYLLCPKPYRETVKWPDEVKDGQLHLSLYGYTKIVRLNEDFFRWLGFWLGDGSENLEKGKTKRVRLSIGSSETQNIQRYSKLTEDLFNVEPHIWHHKRVQCIDIWIEDLGLLYFLRREFRDAKGIQKRLPVWISNLSNNEFQALVQGWFDADGSTANGTRYICCSNPVLAGQLFAEFTRRGLPAGISREKASATYKGVKKRYTTYRIKLMSPDKRHFRITDGIVCARRVHKAEKHRVNSHIWLYDFQVAGDPAFVSPSGILHNCFITVSGTQQRKIFSDDGNDISEVAPEILKELPTGQYILDCELECWIKGKHQPRERAAGDVHSRKGENLVLIAFDCLWDNKDLRQEPFSVRLEHLEKICKGWEKTLAAPKGKLALSPSYEVHSEKDVKDAIEKILKHDDKEGFVWKSADGLYVADRNKGYQIKWHRNVLVEGVVLERHETKVPGVFNYEWGIQVGDLPVVKERILDTKRYLVIGKTFSSKYAYNPGDAITVEVEQVNLLLGEGEVGLTAWAPKIIEGA